jgi:hypothetical protein
MGFGVLGMALIEAQPRRYDMAGQKVGMPSKPVPQDPARFLKITGLSESVGQRYETPPVWIRFGPVEFLQFSDVDFQRLSHRSILENAGKSKEEREVLSARR